MSVPKPDDMSALDNACTVIFGNSLYSYSDKGFLSLPLENSAKWQNLTSGVKVSGAACTGKKLNDPSQASLLVVGGYSDDAAYTGLQEYTFATGKWQTLNPQPPVTKNRRGHAVAYNRATDIIVMFSGITANDGGAAAGASFETWKIQASGSAQVYSAMSSFGGTAPSVSPMLFSWGPGSDIALVSGPQDDGIVFLMNADPKDTNGWRNVGSVKDPWPSDSAAIRATMIRGDDDSMSLLKFDLSQSPNQMVRIPVAKSGSQPIRDATAVTKRDLEVDNWPKYNATNAPDTTRNGFSIAQGLNGMVVLSGGNKDDPVAIFNAKENSWVNATELLGEGTQKILVKTTTSTSTTLSTFSTSISTTATASGTISSTVSATPTETSTAAVASGNRGPSSNTILGITLGTIAAFLALLLVLLILLQRRKRRMNPNQGGVLNPDEKETAAFAKSTPPSASAGHYRGHNPQLSSESYSSVAILMGRMGTQKQTTVTRKPSRSSSRSSTSSLHKQFKSTISKPIPQPSSNVAFDPSVAEPRPRNGPIPAQDGTRRSSGWNKYWSGGSALQILGYGNKRTTMTSERSSRYSEAASARNNARVTQDSATVPPLNFEGPPEVSSVNSGSPIVSQFISKIPAEGIAGTIERPVSPLSTVSGYSSGVPESINEMLENPGGNKPWGTDRAPNSLYQNSKAESGGVPHGTGVSQQPQLAMAATSTDMSWLNLGDPSRK